MNHELSVLLGDNTTDINSTMPKPTAGNQKYAATTVTITIAIIEYAMFALLD